MKYVEDSALDLVKKSLWTNTSNDLLYQDLKDTLFDLLSQDALKVPIFPIVTNKLLSIIEGKHTTFNDISAIAKSDQILGAKLLKVANSPYYLSFFPSVTIEDAIKRIGTEEVKRVLFLLAISSFFPSRGKYRMLFKQFWVHSIAVAFTAQKLGEIIEADTTYCYICGLLHDIGKPLALLAITDIERMIGEKNFFGEELVATICDDMHSHFAELIADKWSLPSLLSQVIINHHKIDEQLKTDVKPKLINTLAIVVYADIKVCEFGYGESDPIDQTDLMLCNKILGLESGDMKELDKNLKTSLDEHIHSFLAENKHG